MTWWILVKMPMGWVTDSFGDLMKYRAMGRVQRYVKAGAIARLCQYREVNSYRVVRVR